MRAIRTSRMFIKSPTAGVLGASGKVSFAPERDNYAPARENYAYGPHEPVPL